MDVENEINIINSRIKNIEAIVNKSNFSVGLNALMEGMTPTDIKVLKTANQGLAEENEKLRSAIEWALGVGDGFDPRKDGEGAYWWRKGLAERAGLRWNGEEYVSI